MRYDAEWIPPHRQIEQGRCRGNGCTNDGQYPGALCIAATLDENGWCAQCRRSPADDDERELRLGI